MDQVTTDPLARVLAIYAAVVATAALGWQVWTWNRSGGHLRIHRLKLKKHASDPRQHRVVVRVVNVGRLPVKVTEMGIGDRTENNRQYIHLEAEPTDGGGALPRTLEHGDSIVAEVPMSAIVERWFPDGRINMSGWARTADGRLRTNAMWPVTVKTPPK